MFRGREKRYILEALRSTWISGGPFVDKFEKKFTKRLGMMHGLTTSSGTSALFLGIKALGLGPGDEVIVPGYTFVAPVNMVLEAGAKPVFADVDPETWCLNLASVKKLLTARTKAILPVHLYGNLCEMPSLVPWARSKKLFIIEDAAQAAFSALRGRVAGTWGDMGCFSFHATKTLTTGEGGFVVTPRQAYLNRMRLLRDHGMQSGKRYWHPVRGYNFRMTNMQAALGCAQLEGIAGIIKHRKNIYKEYRRHLEGEKGILLQKMHPGAVAWTLAVKMDRTAFKMDRDHVMSALAKKGIETRPGFYPLGDMGPYESRCLPVCESLSREVICLPLHLSLTRKNVSYICGELKRLRRSL